MQTAPCHQWASLTIANDLPEHVDKHTYHRNVAFITSLDLPAELRLVANPNQAFFKVNTSGR